MRASTRREFIAGPVGRIECAVDDPEGPAKGVALIAHQHPLYGGTLDNKVVQTLARAFVELGYEAWRPNFRGVGTPTTRPRTERSSAETKRDLRSANTLRSPAFHSARACKCCSHSG